MNEFVPIDGREESLQHKLLPLSANPDFNDDGQLMSNPYYDLSTKYEYSSEVYGTDAIDQAIENLICTEPMERLFNINFWSPLYKVLFENVHNVNDIAEQVYTQIENYIPIKINRSAAKINFYESSHELEINFPYYFNFHGETYSHVFNRIIGR